MRKLDAVVIGSGPNGLAAALTLARASLGAGAHGMCGYRAARSALRRVFGERVEETTPLPEWPRDA